MTCLHMDTLVAVIHVLPLLRMCAAQLVQDNHSKPVPKIAVIGGGIGGTATAYFLHELFGDEVLIDLYESNRVGGRLATLPVADQQYEVGGSVIHLYSQYMRDFAAQFGLSQVTQCPHTIGVFNGQDYAYASSSVGPFDFVKLFLRYGWDVNRLQKASAAVIQDFMKIYRLQYEGRAFKDVASLLSALSEEMLRMTQMSTFDWLREQGLSLLTINELVMAALRFQYGQTPEVHALVGLLALGGVDDSLWSVKGGNKRVAEELLKHSRASSLRREVTQVMPSLETPVKFVVTSQEVEESRDTLLTEAAMENKAGGVATEDTAQDSNMPLREQEYDTVILATPLTHDKSKIKLANFSQQFSFPGYFERIETTLISGIVRPESLMLNEGEMLDNILVMNPSLKFNSFERQHSVEGKNCDKGDVGVWKIFSSHKIPDNQLDVFFLRREMTHAVSWLAYPHYSANQTLGDFELVPGLYYLSALEWAGSAIEMSVIGAKNVALLAYKHWKNDPDAGKKPPIKEEL